MAKVEGDTPEAVAYRLFLAIASVEKGVSGPESIPRIADVDREWILRTYAQCLATVRSPGAVDDHIRGFKPPH